MIKIQTEQTFKQKVGLRTGLIILTLFSAIIFPLALPNELFYYGNPILGFCCLSAYFLALTFAPSFRFAMVLGMIYAVVDTILAHYWLLFFGDFSVWTITGVTVGYMLYHALFAPVLHGIIRFDSKYRVFTIALAWTVYEYLKSSGFLAFPWGILPHTVATLSPFIQLADITGLWGISFIVALVNAMFAEFVLYLRSYSIFPLSFFRNFSNTSYRRNMYEPVPLSFPQLIFSTLFSCIIVLLSLGYGFLMLSKNYTSEDVLKILLVQPNEDPWSSESENLVLNKAIWLTNQGILTESSENSPIGLPEKSTKKPKTGNIISQNRAKLIQELERHIPADELASLKEQIVATGQPPASPPVTCQGNPDLVIWSETSFPYFIREDSFAAVLQHVPQPVSLASFIKSTGAYFIIGAAFMPSGIHDYQNAALFISPDGKLLDYYAKQHPVPIAESIPFWEIKIIRTFFQNNLGLTSSGWQTGNKFTIFSFPLKTGKELKFGVPICFEDSFPDLCRTFIAKGADFFVNITNVSWSKQKSAEIQMVIAALFRTIENRRTLIRATNGGVTAVINPKGEVVQQLELFTAGTLYNEVPIYTNPTLTFYTRCGDYLPIIFAVILLGFLIWHNFFKKV